MARPLKHRKTRKYKDIFWLPTINENILSGLNIVFCRPIEITLFSDELEALRLHNIENLSQTETAKKMNISQPTVARILKKAYKKITIALLKGKKIKIKNIHPHNLEKIGIDAQTLFAIERLKD